MKGLWLSLSLWLCACTSPREEDKPPSGTSAIARVVGGSDLRVVLTSEANAGRVDEIVAGAEPRDFHWSSITIPMLMRQRVYEPGGLVTTLDTSTGIIFTQVYRETCNPALEDFTPCWIYEQYRAAEVGLTGDLSVRLVSDLAEISYHVVWTGVTDRFGDPEQQYTHETIANFVAEVVGGPE